MNPNKVSVFRKENFNAAHRLNNPLLSVEENKAVFGKCNNTNFHGHNYELIVKISGFVDPVTGYVVDMKLLRDIIKEEIIEKFDHKNLNLDVIEFKELNPTAENIAITIYNILKEKINKKHELKIVLYETARNYVIEHLGIAVDARNLFTERVMQPLEDRFDVVIKKDFLFSSHDTDEEIEGLLDESDEDEIQDDETQDDE